MQNYMVDPVLSLGGALALSYIFLAAGVHKWRDLDHFGATLGAYGLLPAILVRPASLLLPLVELAIAPGLLLPPVRPAAAWAGAMLLVVYTLAIGFNLVRGRRTIDCGCGDPSQRQLLSEWLLLRNGVLIGFAVLAGAPGVNRPTGWLDWAVAALAAVTLVLLHSACNQLLSNRDLLANLRSSHG